VDKIKLVDVRRKQELRPAVQYILRQSRHAAIVSSAATLLLATGRPAQAQADAAAGNTSSEPALAEIVVSAQKRTQSLQDVPYNISAIAGDALRDAGVISINSLTELVPGLTNVDQGPANRAGNNNFILRGLRTDAPGGGASGEAFPNLTVSPVSTYFGETPSSKSCA
jgi:iron complex outermembrane receptor protein